MKTKIFDLLRKFNIVQFLKIEEVYFRSFLLTSKKKISKEVVLLNYAEYAPDISFDITYLQNLKSIDVWYSKNSLDESIAIPESYLLYKYFLHQEMDGIIIFNSQPKKILVIKDKMLKHQFSKELISEYELNLLKKEFNIEKISVFTNDEYKSSLEKALKSFSLKDVVSFVNFKFDSKSIIENMVNNLAKPIVLLLILLIGLELGSYFFLEKEMKLVKSDYREIRKETQGLRTRVNEVDNALDSYAFIERSLDQNKQLLNSIENISMLMEDYNATFRYLRISDDNLELQLESNKTSSIFTKMVNTGVFENLKISNMIKMRFSDKERVTLKGRIK
ncbi:MAG TPA: hypothetical protein EYG85_11935 [Crocinitomix sp.]|nr:hypothetical protein [Crocinitomix sp.]